MKNKKNNEYFGRTQKNIILLVAGGIVSVWAIQYPNLKFSTLDVIFLLISLSIITYDLILQIKTIRRLLTK